MAASPTGVDGYLQQLDDVPGWLWPLDFLLFDWLLTRQERLQQPGDLAELGTYQGKSAILIGMHQRPGDRFTVCDLFDKAAPDTENAVEQLTYYEDLSIES